MSSLIPQLFLDELLNRTDIVDLIDSYVPLKKRGSAFIACCPFHNEKTPSFNVVLKKQFYHCFGCGVSGNAISFVISYLNQSFPEAVQTLALRLGMQVPREGTPADNQKILSLYHVLSQVVDFYQEILKTTGNVAIDYLCQRGVSGKIARAYQLGYSPVGKNLLEVRFNLYKRELIASGMLIEKEGKTFDRYRNRVMFPIHDRNGRVIGFGGRALGLSQKPKYLNSPETVIFQKSRELYGLHQVIQNNKTIECIIIVEGYLDVIALSQYGLCNVVAALGTAISSYHIQLLSKYTRKLVFCFDGDSAGRMAAWRALENCFTQLNTGLDAGFVFLPEGQDPDSLIREEGAQKFNLRLKNVTPLSGFFLDTLSMKIDVSSLAGKSQLTQLAKPYLLKMQEGPYKQLLLDELSRRTHMESHRIAALINDTTKKKHSDLRLSMRSPTRLALALLLQYPEIICTLEKHYPLDLSDDLEQNLLSQVLAQVLNAPQTNTALLIELWRNTPFFVLLSELAVLESQVPEDAIAKEYSDIILFLNKKNLEKKINQYIDSSRNHSLSSTDRLLLKEMLELRHQNGSRED